MIELSISQLGPKGDGIHRGEKGAVYVDRALPGERVSARVQRDDQGIERGEIVTLLQSSPNRQAAPCPHYEGCGNCTIQHADETFYREWKLAVVKEALTKYDVLPREWLEPVFIGAGNRRRATFSAVKQKGRLAFGFYKRRTSEITDIDTCLIADPKLLALKERLKPLLRPMLEEDEPVDFFLQIVDGAVDLVITGAIHRLTELTMWLETMPITRAGWRPGDREAVRPLLDQGPILATFGRLRVNLPPDTFLQPTPEGEKALVEAVLAGMPAGGRFADLFAGCGTFTGPLLSRGSVDAFESVISAVKAMSEAAQGLPLRTFRRDLAGAPIPANELHGYDGIVFNPPRAGCREQAIAMARSRVPILVGVSCNPATFARDARILANGGYQLHSVRVVDQFHWSHHVEVVGVFKKKQRDGAAKK